MTMRNWKVKSSKKVIEFFKYKIHKKNSKNSDIVNDYYRFSSPVLSNINDRLYAVNSVHTLGINALMAARNSGFQNITILVIDHDKWPIPKTRLFTSYSPEWVENYVSLNRDIRDPIFELAILKASSFTFFSCEKNGKLIGKFWRDPNFPSEVVAGFCVVSTRLDGSKIAAIYTEGICESNKRNICEDVKSDLEVLSNNIIDTFIDLVVPDRNIIEELTDMELEFLRTLATSDDPSEALKITPKFGSNYSLQNSVKTKLQVESIFQAVSIAVANSWFNVPKIHGFETSTAFSPLNGWDLIKGKLTK